MALNKLDTGLKLLHPDPTVVNFRSSPSPPASTSERNAATTPPQIRRCVVLADLQFGRAKPNPPPSPVCNLRCRNVGL